MASLGKQWRKWIVACSLIVGLSLAVFSIFMVAYVNYVKYEIVERIEGLKSTRSSKFYALSPSFEKNQKYDVEALETQLKLLGFSQKRFSHQLTPNSYVWESQSPLTNHLYLYRNSFHGSGFPMDKARVRLQFEKSGGSWEITQIYDLVQKNPLEIFQLAPKEVGYYFAGRLRKQFSVPLSQIPVSIRYAVIAIEDQSFLEHHGISIRGTARALWKDLLAMKWVQGGSTITQQLMKLLFFSHKKVLSRKLQEALYAFIAESTLEKETILEAYLNEVYLGQRSSRQLHGIFEASGYYFDKPVSELNLAESATLAAMIQRPNYFDPRKHGKRLVKRRNLVLRKMLEADLIINSEYRRAISKELEVIPVSQTLDDAGYYMDYALSQMPREYIKKLDKEALTVYIPLDPYLQNIAGKTLLNHLSGLEKQYKSLKDLSDSGTPLQGALIAVRPTTCEVLAVQGGRSFKQTQFNRAIQGKRQPGSLFKPFVYLTAFEKNEDNESPQTTPITPIIDEPFEWKYVGGQSWSPGNYDDAFRGEVSTKTALMKSINVPTAKVAQLAGIENIAKNIKASGIESRLPLVPSLSLGSAEIAPIEAAQSYTTLARVGNFCKLKSFLKVYDENKNLVYEVPTVSENALNPEATFQTVNIMKSVLTEGTAKIVSSTNIPTTNVAGKTGTSNDFKDAWFVGFSPELLVLVWVGYDVEEKVGLPGALGALPVWIDFVTKALPYLGTNDFPLPTGLTRVKLDKETNLLSNYSCPNNYEEYFLPGTQPHRYCDDPRR